MKKKSPRGIPDFSRAPSRPKDAARPDDAAKAKGAKRAATSAPRAKPQATSSKSGQRGK